MTTPPEPAPPPADTGLDQRVSTLETGQQTILSKLDQLLTGPEQPAEPEQPAVSISEEIRRQLAERDAKAKKDKPAEPAAPAAIEPEKPPVPPVLRRHKIMGWAE